MTEQNPTARPALIRAGIIVAPMCGLLAIGLAITQALGLIDNGPLLGRPRGTWSFALWNAGCFIAGFLLILIGYAFWKELVWARPVTIAFWSLQAALAIVDMVLGAEGGLPGPAGSEARGCTCNFTWLIGLGSASWYFYRKVNVVEYYRTLEMKARSGRPL